MATLLERDVLRNDETFKRQVRMAMESTSADVLLEVPTAAPPVSEADKRLSVRTREARTVARSVDAFLAAYTGLIAGAAPGGQITDNGAGMVPRYTMTDADVETLTTAAFSALSREEFAWVDE